MSNTTKKISLLVIVLIVIGSIWYLESMKVHSSSNGQPVQTLNVDSASSTADMTDMDSSSTSIVVSSTKSVASVNASLASIAATDKTKGDQPAVEIVNPTGFINASSTFTLGSVVGKKVVLLDFWTYSCINCVRTIPYLNAWYQKYQNYGLVIVGIHTPEFDFEKDLNNVQNAVMEYGIKYPVILDSNMGTWNAYNNLYWPNEYLIDMAGYVVHNHVGEGSYAESEAAIQNALKQRATVMGIDPGTIPTGTVNVATQNLNEINSPETYFGPERNSYLANGSAMVAGKQTLTIPSASTIQLNNLYLGGTWDFEGQNATNVTAGAQITYKYSAGKVYIVAAGAANGITVDVMQDGKPITAADSGSDVHNGKVVISENKLYNLVSNSDGGSEHTLQLIVETPGLEAFTFTFG